MEAAYTRLIALLDQHRAHYRLIDHEPEGRTELVSAMRGNALSQAAKCIILMVKIGKKVTKYILAVVPGDTQVDLPAVKALMQGTYIAFASSDIAERLAGSVAGTILPFSFNPELELIVDPSLLKNDGLYFNAARMDRSLMLSTDDYVALAKATHRAHRCLSRKLTRWACQCLKREATAARGQEYLDQMVRLDEGARRLAEFAFSNNPRVDRCIRHKNASAPCIWLLKMYL